MRKDLLDIDYTNHRGERAVRTISPFNIHFDATEFHPEPQWLLSAWDMQRDVARHFALTDIHTIGTHQILKARMSSAVEEERHALLQRLGGVLGMQAGTDLHLAIEPAVRALVERVKVLEAEKHEAATTLHWV